MAGSGSGWLHWGRVDVHWDGALFSLTVPTSLSGWPAVWLDRYLSERLAEVPGFTGDERADVRPATLHAPEDPSAGVRVWGEVTLSGLTPPWPDAAELQRRLEEAVREAVEVSEKATAEGDLFTSQLYALRPGS